MNAPDPLLTLAEARAVLGVSRPTLGRMLRQGEIPVVRVSARRTLIDPADLRAFIAARKQRRSLNDDDPAVTGSSVRTSAGSGGGDDSA